MVEFFIILFFILILIVYGLIEYKKHQKLIYSIPIRIHVNGTRGKSSVTRLIGAGLREGGIKTITKVTGTFPRLILPDGKESAIYRKENANISEQLKIVKYAAAQKADALVCECMALQPIYQRITEHKMLHSTIGVITNVRLDHLDVMGPGLIDVAEALSNTIPENQKFYTSENRVFTLLENVAKKRNTVAHKTDETGVSDEEMKHFKYIEHKENVALALAVCDAVGVNKETALNGMYETIPDEGVLTKNTIKYLDYRINFFNGFGANDPESSLFIWNSIKTGFEDDEISVVLLNTRQDRFERSKQLIEMAANNMDFDYIMLIGESTNTIKAMAVKNRIITSKIINLGRCSPENVLKTVFEVSKNNTTVFAIGNMGMGGAEVAQYLIDKSKSPSPTLPKRKGDKK
ncbi:MAG: poly-gamma-glutamate synthase PgsB [Bacteroidota bacterium]